MNAYPEDRNPIVARFSALSTGIKMLLILILGLFPLGLIAILASIESARENRGERQDEARTRIEISAQRVNSALSRSALIIRVAKAAISETEPTSAVCEHTLQRLVQTQSLAARYALFGNNGALRCATADWRPTDLPRADGARSRVWLARDGSALRFTLYDRTGMPEGVGEFPRETVADIVNAPGLEGQFNLELVQGLTAMPLRESFRAGPLVQNVVMSAPIAGDRLEMRITAGLVPISAAELLMVLMPVLMWICAGVMGWIIVDRLLVKPLVRMQRAVSGYQPGDKGLDLPLLATPAHEISDLGRAFDQVTRTVAKHESDLEAAVERQTRLVREVHHRVKNNLQVVASLLNLHARGAANEDVAAAYGSIQRRVDALAVVHRNHYAEFEDKHGVALKPLISELSANLRGTAPARAESLSIAVDIEALHVTQDVAVSVAFLVTEIVEFAMFCGGDSVRVSLAQAAPGAASLSVESDSLRDQSRCEAGLTERFERIVTGLSRQLRSTLQRDTDAGRYSVEIKVLDGAAA